MGKVSSPLLSVHAKGPVGQITFDRAGPLSTARVKSTKQCDYGPAMAAAKARMTSLNVSWLLLSDSQRKAWSQHAKIHPVPDPYCGRRVLSGKQFYIKINSKALMANQAPLVDPPLRFLANYFISLTASFVPLTGGFNLSLFSLYPYTNLDWVFVSSTKPLSHSAVSFDKRRFYFYKAFPGGQPLYFLPASLDNAKFGIKVVLMNSFFTESQPIYTLALNA